MNNPYIIMNTQSEPRKWREIPLYIRYRMSEIKVEEQNRQPGKEKCRTLVVATSRMILMNQKHHLLIKKIPIKPMQ